MPNSRLSVRAATEVHHSVRTLMFPDLVQTKLKQGPRLLGGVLMLYSPTEYLKDLIEGLESSDLHRGALFCSSCLI